MSVVAVVQARMGSTRLPGKVLLPIGSHPAIRHTLQRVREVIPTVVLAVPYTQDNYQLAFEAAYSQVHLVVGHEHDVLQRFAQAAHLHRADTVVRITGDCPFIDPTVIRDALDYFSRDTRPYLSNFHQQRTYPKGLDVEVFDVRALMQAHRHATDPYQREHVGPAILAREDQPQPCIYNAPNLSHHRWTLDTPADYEFFKAVAARINCEPPHPTTEELLALLEREPELAKINT